MCQRLRLYLTSFVPRRSALDKLFAVLDVWEARRLRPALMAWKRQSDALPHLNLMSTGTTCAGPGLFAGYAATPQRPCTSERSWPRATRMA